jgi:hypothetical protein
VDARGQLGAGGHHDDRDVGAGADPAAHVEAVGVREPEVEQHDIGLPEPRERLRAGGRAEHGEAVPRHHAGQRVRDPVVVLDDEQPHRVSSPLSDHRPAA